MLAIAGVVLLAGCIQPVSPTPTAGPGAIPGAVDAPVQPPVGESGAPIDAGAALRLAIEQFIRDRGEAPNNLQTWPEQPLGLDQAHGYSFTNASGVPCAGFLLTTGTGSGLQPINGALLCALSPDVTALASVWVFLTSDGQPYTVVFGRVEDPAISAVAAVLTDGSNRTVNPSAGGFLIAQPGVVDVNVLTAINAEGNTVIADIPLSAAR